MPEARTPICRSDELVDGERGIRFEAKVSAPQGLPSVAGGTAPAFVVRFRGKARAFLNRCGHVPVELDWEHGEFFDFSREYLICATHGALYGPESGRCISGRCNGRGLTPVAVEEIDGFVYSIEER